MVLSDSTVLDLSEYATLTSEIGLIIPSYNFLFWSRDSSVGIATSYGLDNQGGREFESPVG
jgi:hypothetical protein